MASASADASNEGPRGGQRGKGKARGRGRGGAGPSRGGAGGGGGQNRSNQQNSTRNAPKPGDAPTAPSAAGPTAEKAKPKTDGEEEDDEEEVCFICANPVIHQSVAPCNHRTCHICSLRMRALYKNKECAHCRTLAPFVMFTDDAEKRFEDFTKADTTTTDDNIGIRYTNEDIVGDTVLLLRYNCPDASCDFAGLGWPDLHRHVRSTHHKRMCDLCTRNKKVFTHEHELFSDKEHETHMRKGDDRPGAVDQTGFKGHPLCGFCGSRFYDSDKLYEHCRERHERCFLCDRQNPRTPHYYRDYNSLEEHFRNDHYLCPDRECQEKKFVVFNSEMDLKAHKIDEHSGETKGRDARVVDISGFDYRQTYQQERGSGSGREGNRGRGGREPRRARGRDPNAEPLPPSSAQPLRRDEVAFQRQMAIHSSQSVSNRTFGGQLSSADPTPAAAAAAAATASASRPTRAAASSSSTPARAPEPAPVTALEGLSLSDPNLSSEDRARLMRHQDVIDRALALLQNDRTKLDTFRSQISSYMKGKLTAPALVDAFFSLFTDTSSGSLGTLVREVADLFDDQTKADRLRHAWSDWRAINEDYPTLPGLSGMHGAATSSSGWATAASGTPAQPVAGPSQRHTTRVLKLKNQTQQARKTNTGTAPTGGWGAIAASSSSSSSRPPPAATSFPALPSRNANTRSPAAGAMWGGGSNGSQAAAGSSSSNSAGNTSASASQRNNNTIQRPARPTNTGDAFPALPAAPKPTTTIFGYGTGRGVRRDAGGGTSNFSWGQQSGSAAGAETPEEEEETSGGKGKKGNKGRKKVLVQWG